MIAPIRYLTKEEIEKMNKKLRELGYEGLVKHFLDSGWCLESSIILAKAMLKGIDENDTKTT